MEAAINRALALAAALLGLTGVALAAAGSHALADYLSKPELWRTAQLMHLSQVPCILVLALHLNPGPTSQAARLSALSGWLLVVGVLAFSTTLYLRALGVAFPASVAPIGGLLMLAGWGVLVLRLARHR